MNQSTDLQEFMMIQLMRQFDMIGRTLVMFDLWTKYQDLWFDALQAGIRAVEDKANIGLKPCPFCGSSDIFYCEIIDGGEVIENAFEINCGHCQISLSCGDSTKEEIAELWNRRDEK